MAPQRPAALSGEESLAHPLTTALSSWRSSKITFVIKSVHASAEPSCKCLPAPLIALFWDSCDFMDAWMYQAHPSEQGGNAYPTD